MLNCHCISYISRKRISIPCHFKSSNWRFSGKTSLISSRQAPKKREKNQKKSHYTVCERDLKIICLQLISPRAWDRTSQDFRTSRDSSIILKGTLSDRASRPSKCAHKNVCTIFICRHRVVFCQYLSNRCTLLLSNGPRPQDKAVLVRFLPTNNLFSFLINIINLTPSLPQPVKFPGWKVLTHACKQYIFRFHNKSNSNIVCFDENSFTC